VEVFVDDRRVDDALAAGATVEDAVRLVQSSVCSADRMVVGLRCDGRDIPADAMPDTLGKPANSFERLDVITGGRAELVADAMARASTCLSETEGSCRRVAELLTEAKTVEAAEMLGDCLRIWQQIYDAVGKSIEALQLDPERTTINDESLMDLIGKPKNVLLQIKSALQARDHVLLADILQYEFQEVTKSWHDLIAGLRRETENLITSSEV
jgi:hypothetical protein